MQTSALVDCDWLSAHLDDSDLVILDATFFLPRQQLDGYQEFRKAHIPGARFFDIDRVADPKAPLPHTFPDEETFSQAAGSLGIDNNSLIIIYDNNRFFAAARAWWMFRVYGHQHVRVLDGGLHRWRHSGFKTEAAVVPAHPKQYSPRFQPELLYRLEQIRDTVHTGQCQIVDSRSADNFAGRRPLSDPGLQPGHIPGSLNIPYQQLTDPEQHTLLLVNRLKQLFSNAEIELNQPIVTTCGSGVSAAVLTLALFECGIKETAVYDGSWAEWGRCRETEKQVN